VADQDEVDAGPRGRVQRRDDAAQGADGRQQHGIGEHRAPGQLDPDVEWPKNRIA
jgi:hypothetical protein